MNLKKIMATLLACVATVGISVSAVTLDTAEAAKEADSKGAVLAESTTVSTWDGTSYSLDWLSTGNPEGTAGDFFYINSAADLAGLAYYVNNYSSTNNIFTGDTVYLNVDIDLANYAWTPIGSLTTEKRVFYGSFDGQGHTIYNLNVPEDRYYAGLFGKIKTLNYTQVFENLTIHNATVVANDDTEKNKEGAGALIGDAYGAVVENCHVTGTVNISSDCAAGGLLGRSYAKVTNCSVEASGTISARYAAGGLIGTHNATDSYPAVLENCSVIGDEDKGGITLTVSYNGVGGVVGSLTLSNTTTATVDGLEAMNLSLVNTNTEELDEGMAYLTVGYTPTNSAYTNIETTSTPDDAETAVQFAAEVGGVYYATLEEAFKAVTAENKVVEILSDVTVDYAWDCRNTGAKFTVPVEINGNGHTLKFTGEINDGYNHLAVFRTEAEAEFNDLTVDMSEAISVFNGRFRAISAKTSLTVNNCYFIGNPAYTNTRAIIFGEGAGDAVSQVVVNITNSEFDNWTRGLTDNENAQDVKSVTVTDSSFLNSDVAISAGETVTFNNNILLGAGVAITTYADATALKVVATGNTLDSDESNFILADEIATDSEEFILPAAELNGKKYMSIAKALEASVDGNVIYVQPGTYEEDLVINNKITLKGISTTSGASLCADEKPVILLTDVTNGGLEYHSPNVTFENLVFKVTDDAAGLTWNVSAIGYYYEVVADRENLTVTNCDFINESDIAMSAIAANIGKYTITGCTFTGFANGVHTYLDHGAANEIIVSENTFTDVDNIIVAYHGAPATDAVPASITVTNNVVNGDTASISIDNFGMTKDTPATAYKAITVTGNTNAELCLGNYDVTSFTLTTDEELSYSYRTEAIMRASDGNLPDGVVYVIYDDAITEEINKMFIVVDGYVKTEAASVELVYKPASEDNSKWDIYLVANSAGIINRLNSGDFTFVHESANAMSYEIIASNDEVVVNNVEGDRYEFHYDGKTGTTTDTALEIKIASVEFTGYGAYTFTVKDVTTNAVHATTFVDNIVASFTTADNSLVFNNATEDTDGDEVYGTIDSEIVIPTADLTIKVAFPNNVNNNELAYQKMNVLVTGNDIAEVSIDLGTDNTGAALTADSKHDCEYTVAFDEASCEYTVVIKNYLTLNTAYNVAVSGAGYRTARYTVTMTDDKSLNFWNNVKDNEAAVEEGKYSTTKNFLAGDIVGDNEINIYDLSAVVSYFSTEITDEADYARYVKYDLNRDGVIDSKDVAYILVSWGA